MRLRPNIARNTLGFRFQKFLRQNPQATKLSYGWIRTGQTKHVETTGTRTRLNIVGAK